MSWKNVLPCDVKSSTSFMILSELCNEMGSLSKNKVSKTALRLGRLPQKPTFRLALSVKINIQD